MPGSQAAPMRIGSGRWCLALLAIALGYFICGKAALLLAIPPGYATAVWPAAGLALAAVLMLGHRVWPGVFLGSLLVNLGTSLDASSLIAFVRTVPVPAVIACGATLQALCGAALVRKFVGYPTAFSTEKQVLRFSLLVCLCCSVSATVGVATLGATGHISRSEALINWTTWYVGDSIGTLLFAPLVLIWRRRSQDLRRKLSVTIPLLSTFVIVVTLFVHTSRWEHDRLELEFAHRTSNLVQQLQHDFAAYINILHSVGSFFASSDTVARDEFRKFIAHDLAAFPAVKGLSWDPRVPDSARADFEETARTFLGPDFRIVEMSANHQFVPAAVREEYVPVLYIAPDTERNVRALGFDVASEPMRRAALARARDTGEPAATERTVLVQDTQQIASFVVFLPIYANDRPHGTVGERRENLRGYVAAVFRIGEMVQQTTRGLESSGINFRLFDETNPAEKQLLVGPRAEQARTAAASRATHMDMAGRRWVLEFALSPEYLLAHRSWQAWTLLVAGLLFSVLLGALLLVVTGRTERDELLVAARTSELVALNDRLEREVAERRAAQSANQQILNNSLDLICTMDAEGRFTGLNRAAEKLFGYPPQELIGRRYLELVHPEDVGKTVAVTTVMMTGKDMRDFENRFVRKDGSIVPVTWTAQWSELDNATFAIARDASAQKRAEMALTTAKEAAEAATRAKSEFLANMSHEIRTPMNGIIGMTDLTLETELTRTQREYLEMVKHSADSLLSLLNDILDFSKIEAGKLSLEAVPFDLRVSLEKTLKTLGLRAGRKGLALICRIESDVPAMVVGDPARLRQVVINLIDNAIKFTETGEINLRVQVAPALDRLLALEFCVSDTGIGIAPEKQEMVFSAFAQADGSTTRTHGGTGLGLAISSWLVTQMSGRLTLESEPGKGSTFRFSAIFGRAVGQIESQTNKPLPVMARSSDRLVPLRILVADDNPINRSVAAGMLQKRGDLIEFAENGAEAVELMRGKDFDLILMDLQMPILDGFNATAQIRDLEDGTGRHIPIVAMTAHAMKGDRERCLNAGMDDYIAKPVNKQELLELVAKIAGDSSASKRPTLDATTEDDLLARFDGDADLLQRVSQMFLEQTPSMLAKLRQAAAAQDAIVLRQTAHSLIGSLGALGAQDALACARKLEALGSEGLCEAAADIIRALETEVDTLQDRLTCYA